MEGLRVAMSLRPLRLLCRETLSEIHTKLHTVLSLDTGDVEGVVQIWSRIRDLEEIII